MSFVQRHDDMSNLLPINLDLDLESVIIKTFDRLVEAGEILWAPYTTETISQDGVNLAFQLSPHLKKKPVQDRNDEERKTGKGRNPFIDPDPNFIIAESVGPHHTLLLNKFCTYRPMLILHTKDFVPQEEALDANDIHAAWSLLGHFQRDKQPRDYMLIYNCGFDSGSSQGHKHMQLWHRPTKKELGFDIFPDHATSETEIATNLRGTPIRHYVLRLNSSSSIPFSSSSTDTEKATPQPKTSTQVHAAYQRLLVEINKCHKEHGSTSHNVALTRDWICAIPRRSNGLDKGAGANTAGALGTVWISDPEEKQIWLTPDIKSHLGHIGVPLE